jgi:hypothetical protein
LDQFINYQTPDPEKSTTGDWIYNGRGLQCENSDPEVLSQNLITDDWINKDRELRVRIVTQRSSVKIPPLIIGYMRGVDSSILGRYLQGYM